MLKQHLEYPIDKTRFYQAIRHLPWPIWLDTGQGTGFDILVADPVTRLIADNGLTRVIDQDGKTRRTREPLPNLLRDLLRRTESVSDLPFDSGAVGYFSYDYGRRLQDMAGTGSDADLPEAALGIYDWAVILDHARRQAWLVAQNKDSRSPNYWQLLQQSLEEAVGHESCNPRGHFIGEPVSNMSRSDYAAAFHRIQRYLTEGDCYQVNLAQRFSIEFNGDPWQLYQQMRKQNPAPYGAYLEFPFASILSSSPEQFVGLQGNAAISRPIKGTRPRGAGRAQDERLASELLQSNKDRAENLMIVDLLRNDLGRVCKPGSIEVPELFKLESHPSVHHLVSTITGHLREHEDAFSLLQACFPGGSITGAPKHRAMEIIQELEPDSRQIYCGSIGWIGCNGNMNTNIAIRTLLILNGQAMYWAGGGIVADSEEAEEYQETLDKAAAFLRLAGGEG